MREAFFRGKSVKTGEWITGDLTGGDTIHTGHTWQDIDGSGEWWGVPVIPETIGQYTGLKDKNGKMIFEGDIISSKDSKYDDILHKIVFEDACFRIKSIQTVIERFADCGRLKQDWVNEFEKEVVGNIHDNPELIKKVRK